MTEEEEAIARHQAAELVDGVYDCGRRRADDAAGAGDAGAGARGGGGLPPHVRSHLEHMQGIRRSRLRAE